MPAICKQVLTPDKSTSIAGVVRDYVAAQLGGVPQGLAQSGLSLANQGADELAQAIESYKKSGSSSQSGVLGTSTHAAPSVTDSIFNNVLDALAFLVHHWPWTMGAAALAGVGMFVL